MKRKGRIGRVIANKMQKTVTVRVERTIRHPRFDKIITHAKKYYAHCTLPDIQVGQWVRIVETRPLSKLKRWRVVGVMPS